MRKNVIIAGLCSLALSAGAVAGPNYLSILEKFGKPSAKEQVFESQASYRLCFVPDGASCEKMIVAALNAETQRIRVQAYSFTSAPVAEALVKAHQRGVKVEVLLDESQETERYTGATFLANAGIPVRIDHKVAIAHNKVLILEGIKSVFTGSFNFSKSAETRNAENGILIRDSAILKAYNANWDLRYKVTRPYTGPKTKAKSR